MRVQERPNIILISIDCGRADHLSAYGYHRLTSPKIEKIASEGVLFKNCISSSAWTLPSHASMFTGLYTCQHRTDDGNYWLDAKHPVMAETLNEAGYATAGFSRVPWVSTTTGLSRGFQYFQEYFFKNPSVAKKYAFAAQELFRLLLNKRDAGAKRTTKKVKQWIDANRDKPFFAFIHLWEAHITYRLPGSQLGVFLDGYDLNKARQVNQHYDRYIAGVVKMTAEDFNILGRLYDATLLYLDGKIGEIVDHLRDLNLLDDTLLIITADHGENIGDHNLMGHKISLHDSLIKVPLVVRYPKAFPAGTTSYNLVQQVDFFPTVLELLGIDAKEVNPNLKGASLTSLVNGDQRREFTVSEQAYPNLNAFKRRYPEFDCAPINFEQKAIRTSDYKYIWHSNNQDELYDLSVDPAELNNLITEREDKARELNKKLFDFVNNIKSEEGEEENIDLPDEVKRQLEGLGYYV